MASVLYVTKTTMDSLKAIFNGDIVGTYIEVDSIRYHITDRAFEIIGIGDFESHGYFSIYYDDWEIYTKKNGTEAIRLRCNNLDLITFISEAN